MSNYYPVLVNTSYDQQSGMNIFNPQLAAMNNFNHQYAIHKKFVENNSEIYDSQSLQNAILNLGKLPLMAPIFPPHISPEGLTCFQQPSLVSLCEVNQGLINETHISSDTGMVILLSTMFMATCGNVQTNIQSDWQENASLFIIGISRTGTQKSTIIARLKMPFNNFEKEDDKKMNYETQLLIQQENNRLHRKRIKEKLAKKAAGQISEQELFLELKELGKDQKQINNMIFSQSLFISSATPAGFLKTLNNNDGVINILDSEPQILELLTKDEQILNLFLSSYTGERFGNVNAYKNYTVDTPCINMCTMCQPQKAQQFFEHKDFSDRGLFGRTIPLFNNQSWVNEGKITWQNVTEFYEKKFRTF